MTAPPSDTRAHFRGRCLEKFSDKVKAINWDRIVFASNGKEQAVDLKDLVDYDRAVACNAAVDRSDTVEALLEAIGV